MRRPQVAWLTVALLGVGALLVIAVALRAASTDPRNRPTRDRYLRWLSEQGGGGYFAMGETWGVGSDFEGMARRAHHAVGGTVCLLANGICAPLHR
jgi:hypothetical protein